MAVHVVAGFSVIVFMDAYTDFLRQYVFALRNPVDSIAASLSKTLEDILSLRFLWELVLYMTILSIGFARAYYVRLQDRRLQATELRADLTEARLQALRMQINPHFLFNTLNAIAGLVERDPKGARTMAARLRALRRTVEDDGDGTGRTLSGDGLPDTSNGIGLRNVRERLERLYGENHRFSLRPSTTGGLAAQIWLPFHTEPVDVPDAPPRPIQTQPAG